MARGRRIRTLLYGDQAFSSNELDLLHTPAMQRLYDLHQLGLTDRVFVDASHSRFHHVIGVVQQAEDMMASLIKNLRLKPGRELDWTGPDESPRTYNELADYCERRKPAIRLMALLHDLTHAPYGHTLEDEIQLLEQKHDDPVRQADAFFRLLVQYIGWLWRDSSLWTSLTESEGLALSELRLYLDRPDLRAPPVTDKLIEEMGRLGARVLLLRPGRDLSLAAPDGASTLLFLKDLAFAMRALLHLDLAHQEPTDSSVLPSANYAFDKLFASIFKNLNSKVDAAMGFLPQRDAFLLDIIGNTVCADLLDYAKRDSHFAGLKLDYDSARIVENFTLVTSHWTNEFIYSVDGHSRPHPFSGDSIRTAVSLFSHKFRADVPGELLSLLQIRFYVYQRMLFHPTKCIAGAMLGAAMQRMGWRTIPPHAKHIGDAAFLREASESARLVRSILREEDDPTTVFDTLAVSELKARLATLPELSTVASALHLADDLLPKVSDLIDYLDVSRFLRPENTVNHDAFSRHLVQILGELSDMVNEGSIGPGDALTDEHIELLLSARRVGGATAVEQNSIVELLTNFRPTFEDVMSNLNAGLDLLDRLVARRYHRLVFRLLPSLQQTELEISATHVAHIFTNCVRRRQIEEAIERRAQLPPGTVVIHCPKSDGPKKIANILITDDKGESEFRWQPLKKIGLLGKMFEKHEDAVAALEEMYESTWRLIVGVAPPHDVEFERINDSVGNVLYEVLSGGKSGVPFSNDEYMVAELRMALDACAESTYPADLHLFRRGALQIVENLPILSDYVRGLPIAATSDKASDVPKNSDQALAFLNRLVDSALIQDESFDATGDLFGTNKSADGEAT